VQKIGSASSTAKIMVEIKNENCMDIAGVDTLYNSIL
jgi:hypothetical protein